MFMTETPYINYDLCCWSFTFASSTLHHTKFIFSILHLECNFYLGQNLCWHEWACKKHLQKLIRRSSFFHSWDEKAIYQARSRFALGKSIRRPVSKHQVKMLLLNASCNRFLWQNVSRCITFYVIDAANFRWVNREVLCNWMYPDVLLHSYILYECNQCNQSIAILRMINDLFSIQIGHFPEPGENVVSTYDSKLLCN